MPKPTLVQTILGRPSQSYSLPAEKSAYYHSTKPELFRLYARRGAHDVHAASAGHRRSSSEVFQQVWSPVAPPLQHPNPSTVRQCLGHFVVSDPNILSFREAPDRTSCRP